MISNSNTEKIYLFFRIGKSRDMRVTQCISKYTDFEKSVLLQIPSGFITIFSSKEDFKVIVQDMNELEIIYMIIDVSQNNLFFNLPNNLSQQIIEIIIKMRKQIYDNQFVDSIDSNGSNELSIDNIQILYDNLLEASSNILKGKIKDKIKEIYQRSLQEEKYEVCEFIVNRQLI